MWVILDRDGVINADSVDYIKSLEEWHPIPGSLEAIAQLIQAGHSVLIATNQSGLARGLFDASALNAIHDRLRAELQALGAKLGGIYVCPHHPDAGCACRKPKPGLLQEMERDFSIDWGKAILVGDSWRDMEAARAMGCAVILVKTGNGEKTLREHPELESVAYEDLSTWVKHVVGVTR